MLGICFKHVVTKKSYVGHSLVIKSNMLVIKKYMLVIKSYILDITIFVLQAMCPQVFIPQPPAGKIQFLALFQNLCILGNPILTLCFIKVA